MAIKTYKKGDATKIAPDFRAREFDCQGRGCCSTTPIDEKLVRYLQEIRTHFGKPVYVTAYRCKNGCCGTGKAFCIPFYDGFCFDIQTLRHFVAVNNNQNSL